MNFDVQFETLTLNNTGNTGMRRKLMETRILIKFSFPSAFKINCKYFPVMFTTNSSRKPGINGGPLREPYTFSQFHFHWCKFNY